MAQIIDFSAAKEERLPHLRGKAYCMSCQHSWDAVAPVGETQLQCPECDLMKGIFVNPVERDELHWQCACGNSYFLCGEASGMYCPNCGAIQSGF